MPDVVGKLYDERPKPKFSSGKKLVRGVGINNGEYPSKINNIKLKQHRLWCDMLARCYLEDIENTRRKSYADVYVCDRWLDYANFYEDITAMPFFSCEDYHMDKDILTYLSDDVSYSPETVAFVPKEINQLFQNRGKVQNVHYKIYSETNKVYVANITKFGKTSFIGAYQDYEEACKAQWAVESYYMKDLAEKSKHMIEDRVYNKLLEISDLSFYEKYSGDKYENTK